ncbi:hypothetical protein CAOG_08927 [Capsaspora owczarzaki ATCC 30864]|uniref:hypothetical protein n=1 Tax=Capsaspora owczarzaki (strain ATCC 30864) TaxID=595528 RepID=UPI0003521ABC|nr:hypothetical protein CAOG_08927 [Capsaspora owczarzaki ATCC 30864]|eukprot:XP_011270598.1 hypothetical protein CAOG_08927 [Capsaspora owczarzaki ATCC 30864]
MSKLSVLEIQTVLDKYAEVSGLSESEIAKAIWAAMSLEVYQFARMENISENLPPSELMASLWAMQEWESRKVTAAPPQPQLQPSYKAPFYDQRGGGGGVRGGYGGQVQLVGGGARETSS